MIRGFGLSRTSYVVCEQISTIDITELKAEKYVGTITDENLLSKIVNGVITQIGGSA
jgi:mRNA-degrading endonuclease toxin of MazEF toxin-antitoxin module